MSDSDLDAFVVLRLEALRSHPEAYGSDHEEWRAQPRERWISCTRNNERQLTFVAADAAGRLVAMAAVYRDDGAKVRHSANIVGVYVRPDWRRAGISAALVNACAEWARASGCRIVRLNVVTTNEYAIRCYQRCGFTQYGLADEVIRANGRYHDEILMSRRLVDRSEP